MLKSYLREGWMEWDWISERNKNKMLAVEHILFDSSSRNFPEVNWFEELHLSRIVLDFSLWVGIVLVICPQFFPSKVKYQGLLPIVLDHKIFLS